MKNQSSKTALKGAALLQADGSVASENLWALFILIEGEPCCLNLWGCAHLRTLR
jgi:hypothetical protein